MSKLLLSVLVCWLHVSVFAQHGNWLTENTQQQLALLYRSNPIISDGADLESKYLSAYQSFFSYISFEQSNDADDFYAKYKSFEELKAESCIYQLMDVNLSIQKSLLLFMQGKSLEGGHVFYKAHRAFLRLDASECGAEYLKLQALFEIFLAQIPEQHHFFTSLIGLVGNEKQGFARLERYLQTVANQQGIYQEAIVLYGYCLLKFGKPTYDEFYDYIALTARHQSPIMLFLVSSIALKNRWGSDAVEASSLYIDAYNQKFPLLFYVKGRALLNAMDAEAIKAFEAYYQHFSGDSYKADADMREAWWHHIHQDRVLRDKKVTQCTNRVSFPTSNDKQARDEVGSLPNEPVELLKARLFFDGGYYQRAKQTLVELDQSVLSDYFLAEYYYRYARVCHELDEIKQALVYYNMVVSLCHDDDRYIGPYAALEAAAIYSSQYNSIKSIELIEKAETLNTGQYKSDIKHKIASLKREIE